MLASFTSYSDSACFIPALCCREETGKEKAMDFTFNYINLDYFIQLFKLR